MTTAAKFAVCLFCLLTLTLAAGTNCFAQNKYEVLTGANLTKVVPTSFYFAGQSAETQMRNAAAATVGADRYVIAGLVDTSGYATEISGKYEGFFITDSPVQIGSAKLDTGAYGFGFTQDGKLNIFDLSSKEILSVGATLDAEMKRPRPLLMTSNAQEIRLYRGKYYVAITAR